MFAIKRSRSENIKNAIVCLEIPSVPGDMLSRSWWLFRLFQIISGTEGSHRKKKLLYEDGYFETRTSEGKTGFGI